MKKILTFIPLGVGISAAIIYILNVIQFKIINNGTALLQILMTLKIYLFISIGGFALYFFIKVLDSLTNKNKEEQEDFISNEYEPFENNNSISSENTLSNINNVNDFNNVNTLNNQNNVNDFNNVNTLNNQNNVNSYVPNYDYVPMYHAEEKQDNIKEIKIDKKDKDKDIDLGPLYNNEENNVDKEDNFTSCKYCTFCGNKINAYDLYCSHCGNRQDKKKMSPLLKNVINVLEIVILILIIYFSLNMLFDYKESRDPSFKSPFKVSMTK